MDLTCDGDRIEIAGNRSFRSTRAGCVSRDGPRPKRFAIRIDCCLRSCGRRRHTRPVSWQSAIDRIASAIQETQAAHGRDAVGVFGGGSLTNEKAYLLGKFARVALGTSNIDYNGRFCMSSAAAGATMAFGLDRGLPFPLEDIPRAEAILLVGGNMAETMPPVMRYFEAQQRNGGALIVADPRRSPTAQWATLHLALRPGSDAALANGLVHLLIRDSLIDRSTSTAHRRIRRCEAARGGVLAGAGRSAHRRSAAPTRRSRPHARAGSHRDGADGARRRAAVATGVNNVLAFINIALALGKVGQPFSGYGTITGQGNGQGGREHGQKADQLPGYRRIDDPARASRCRRDLGHSGACAAGAGKSAYELIESAGEPDGIRALFVIGSNPIVSAPNASRWPIASGVSTFSRRRLLSFGDGESGRRGAAFCAVGGGGRHRSPISKGASSDAGVRSIRPVQVRTDIEILCALARALGKSALFRVRRSRIGLRGVARGDTRRSADYSGISYDRIEREGGVFWPCTV